MNRRPASKELSGFSRVLVTGGAGFIGSHLVDRLMDTGCRVRVIDDLSNGRLENIDIWMDNPQFDFVRGSLRKPTVARKAVEDVEFVLHLAANPEVRVEKVNPSVHFHENLQVTFNVLEAMRRNRKAAKILFFSSSTVYGEPTELPTSEDYGPLLPISIYGATKLGCEALVSSFCYTYDMRSVILRLANIIGERSNHGVIFDFINKLQTDSETLVILGDGNQIKSYLHVADLLDAIFLILHDFLNGSKPVDIFNIGSLDQIRVRRIAEIVCAEMGLRDADLEFTGGVDGGRGWKGDVRNMLLSVERLQSLGWSPKLNSEESVVLACKELLRGIDK